MAIIKLLNPTPPPPPLSTLLLTVKENSNENYICWGLNELMYIAHEEQWLAHAKHSLNVNYFYYIVNINLLMFQTKLCHFLPMPSYCQEKNTQTTL